VVLPPDFPVERLADSKALSPAAREKAEALIRERALAWGIGWASEGEIDRINILQASLLAMERAFEALEGAGSSLWSAIKNTFPLEGVADGLYIPRLPIPCRAMVRADAQVPEVMAASILAKTARDALMRDYARLYPGYGYESHKGYPTRAHREAIARLGPSPIQRRSFAHQ
jgi:ribonuclease HII